MNNFVINKLIGAGEYGKVYKAKNKNGRTVVIKNSDRNLRTERNIAKKLEGFNVPAVYDYRELLISEYIKGETFKSFIRGGMMKDPRTLIRQVLSNLQKIHKKMSTFRHHDLHLENIMVFPGDNVRIMDFGLSTLRGIKNPNIVGFKKDYGISPDSHVMYDAHLFLNSLYAEGVMKSVIESLLPKGYLGEEGEGVKNFRLRGDVDHKEALKDFTYQRILDAFKPKTNAKKIIQKIISTKPVKKISPKKKSPVNQNAAKKAAMAFLASKKSPEKKAPLKKPGLTKSKPVPLTRGSPLKKNNSNNKR